MLHKYVTGSREYILGNSHVCVYVFCWLLLFVFLSLGSGLTDANGFLWLCVRTLEFFKHDNVVLGFGP